MMNISGTSVNLDPEVLDISQRLRHLSREKYFITFFDFLACLDFQACSASNTSRKPRFELVMEYIYVWHDIVSCELILFL